VTFPPHHM